MNQAKCTTCGAGLTIKQGDKTCVCDYCQTTNIVENALALGKVEVDVTEDIKKLRANLTTFVQQNSIDEILRVSQKLLDWIPQDFVALYFFGYAKQQQNQPRFLYDFYKEPPVHTQTELEVVVEHIIHKSELRDKRRIIHWFESFGNDLVQRYLTIHKEREDQENNYANVPRDVFICFSSYNVEIAEKLVEELKADGNTCWISTRNLRPNDAENYWKNIENAIQKSSIVLVISSADSMLSKDVHQEIDYAIQYNKRIIEFKIDDAPHNTLFKHVFDGNKWIKGNSNYDQSYSLVLQRIYEEIYNLKSFPSGKIKYEKSQDEKIEKIEIINEGKKRNSITDDEIVTLDKDNNTDFKLNDFEATRLNDLFQKGDRIIKLQNKGSMSVALSLSGSLFVWGKDVEILAGIDQPDVFFPLNVTGKLNLRNDELIKTFYLGNKFISVLTSKSRVLMLGRNNKGQIGCGERKLIFLEAYKDIKNDPIDITDKFDLAMDDYIVNLSLGHSGASALSSEGEIYLWGTIYGIANDSNVAFDTPKKVTKYIDLSIEDSVYLVRPQGLVSNLGRIFIWSGRVINSSNSHVEKKVVLEPEEITERFNLAKDDRIIKFEAGAGVYCAITLHGRVYTWGGNSYGQLGNGSYVRSDTPCDITQRFNLEKDDKIIGVSIGSDHLLAFSKMNRTFSWGENAWEQLGFRTKTTFFNREKKINIPTEITPNFILSTDDKITSVNAGFRNSSLLTSSGRAYTWGSGQLGNGENPRFYDQPVTEITSNFKLL